MILFRNIFFSAAVIGGAVVGLLCAILLVMFIVYRMRKKDEGSYVLDEPKRNSPSSQPYNKNSREFYAWIPKFLNLWPLYTPLLELPSPSPANLFRPDFRPFPCLLPVNLRLLYQLLVLIIFLFKYFVDFLPFLFCFSVSPRPIAVARNAPCRFSYFSPSRCSAHFSVWIVKLAPPTERWLACFVGGGGDLVKFCLLWSLFEVFFLVKF